jgi:3-oxoacyl-[acyl-carrier-protein] synthase II
MRLPVGRELVKLTTALFYPPSSLESIFFYEPTASRHYGPWCHQSTGNRIGPSVEGLISGRSGISRIESLPTNSLPVHSGAEVKDFTGKIEDYGPLDKAVQRSLKKNMKVMCREIEMGVAAAQKALTHSGLSQDRDPERCGCLFGCDYILTRPEEYADGLRNCRRQCASSTDRPEPSDIERWVAAWPQYGLPKVNPLWLLKYLPNMPNSHVSIYNDFRGPNNSITVRETSMNLSLAEAASIIQRGAADVMLVGANGSRIHPLRTTHLSLVESWLPNNPIRQRCLALLMSVATGWFWEREPGP